MGRMLVRQIDQTEGCALAGGTAPAGSDAIGADIGTLAGLAAAGVTVGDDAGALFAAADAVLEFTAPAATVEHARLAALQERLSHIDLERLGEDEKRQLLGTMSKLLKG